MNPTFRRWFYGLIALQIVLVGQLIVYKQLILQGGQTLLLRTEPVDPEDLFRGQYVALGYDFSRLTPDEAHDGDYRKIALAVGETVYVALRRQGRFWVYDHLSQTPPEDTPVFLKGRVTGVRGAISIECGIESYFVPRGEGPKLEEQARRPGAFLAVTASVDRHGDAVLRAARPETGKDSRATRGN